MAKVVKLTMRGGPKDGATVSYHNGFGELPRVFVFQGLFGPERVFGIYDYRQTGPREYTWVDLVEDD